VDNRHKGEDDLMANRNGSAGGGKSKANKTIIIPELEQIAEDHNGYWSDEEINIVRAYYNRIPASELVKYLNKTFGTKRTVASIYNLKVRLGADFIDAKDKRGKQGKSKIKI
jgi:hypothetical protein